MHNTTRAALAAAIALASLTFAGPAVADSHNCPDYATQEEAQAALDRNPSDPDNLDADDDGIACESNPAPYSEAYNGNGEEQPEGGVDAGSGGSADGGINGPALVGLGTLLTAGGVVVLRRRLTAAGRHSL